MTTQHIFKISTVRIVEDETMRDLSLDQVKEVLKSSYPEVTQPPPAKRWARMAPP